MQITIGTIPRAFVGLHETKQKNALISWLYIKPRPEIILLCDDPGVKSASQKFGCKFIPDIKRNPEFNNVPLISDAFSRLQLEATRDTICFMNTDIIVLEGLVKAAEQVAGELSQFVIVGQRWDVDISLPVDFSSSWKSRIRDRVTQAGNLHAACGIDYFLFSRGTIPEIPPFVVGSPGWDNWIIQELLRRDIPVIDATKTISVVHQDAGRGWPAKGTEYNRELAGGNGHGGFISDSTWILDEKGLRRK